MLSDHMVGIVHEAFKRVPVIDHMSSIIDGIASNPPEDMAMDDSIAEPCDGFEPLMVSRGNIPCRANLSAASPRVVRSSYAQNLEASSWSATKRTAIATYSRCTATTKM
jgi:hypothetical protein